MTSGSPEAPSATRLYVSFVAVAAVLCLFWAVVAFGLPQNLTWFGALLLLGFIAGLGRPQAIGSVQMSAAGIVQLAAIPLLGPVGTAIIAAAPEAFRRTEPIKRVFNTSQRGLLATAASVVYTLVGGQLLSYGSINSWTLAWQLAVAAAVGALVNAALLARVLQLSDGGSLRQRFLDISWQALTAYEVYAVAAFLLAVLWAPAGMGWVSTIFFLPSLLVIQWGLRQLAVEWTIRHGALAPFVTALDLRHPGAEESSRLAEGSARAIALAMRLRPGRVDTIAVAARLRDVGLLALDGQPAAIMRRDHAEASSRVLGQVGFLGKAQRLIAASHERYDGRGGPGGLVGDQIPVGSRILAVADVWSHAIMEGRSSREAVVRCESLVGKTLDLHCVVALRRAHQRGQLPSRQASP